MTLPRFDYVVPGTVEEALAAFSDAPGAGFLLGGTDLLPQLRVGKRSVARVVDVKRVPALSGIRETEDGSLAIGAAVPLADVETHPLVAARYPVLVECVKTVGAWPLRNRATLAGNVCNASPAADTAVALLVLDAVAVALGPSGRRTIPMGGFFLGPGQTALAKGELLTEIVLPASSAGWRGGYLRLSRRKGMDLATVGVLVAAKGENGRTRHRVALAAVAPTPLRVPDAEALLDGQGAAKGAREAGEAARAACRPISDTRGSAAYRREMVGVLVARGASGLSGAA